MSSFPRVLRNAVLPTTSASDPTPDGPPPAQSLRVLRQPSMGGVEHAAVPDPTPVVDAEQAAYERGLEDGREAARQHLMSASAALEAALESGRDQLRAEFDRQRDEIVRLAVDLTTLVIGHDQHDQGRALLVRLNDALAALDDSDLIVAMNEVDLPIAESLDATGISVVADPELAPGEARVIGQWAQADLTRSAAQQILKEHLE